MLFLIQMGININIHMCMTVKSTWIRRYYILFYYQCILRTNVFMVLTDTYWILKYIHHLLAKFQQNQAICYFWHIIMSIGAYSTQARLRIFFFLCNDNLVCTLCFLHIAYFSTCWINLSPLSLCLVGRDEYNDISDFIIWWHRSF